ncbi:MAG: hypothetical protein HHJ17_02615 [Rhodoferax sp.]|uniref:hypothetical protein n=1 Tax=Rhodoferax sp. TaxID=50421 RepID=UPI0017AE0981|nr:hypothetical protein [Rhodoferax sp.]NMM12424.1 hypothetical protein [Rhodoferax sp.]
MPDEIDRLKSLVEAVERDERWRAFGNRSLEQHHGLVAGYSLHDNVPYTVVQHFENAKNTWLYAFFSYRLLHVALMQLHVAGEVAMKERAKCDGISTKGKALNELLNLAIERRWLLDVNFEVTAERSKREAEHLEMLHFMGVEHEPFVGPLHEQDYAKGLVAAFRWTSPAFVDKFQLPVRSCSNASGLSWSR